MDKDIPYKKISISELIYKLYIRNIKNPYISIAIFNPYTFQEHIGRIQYKVCLIADAIVFRIVTIECYRVHITKSRSQIGYISYDIGSIKLENLIKNPHLTVINNFQCIFISHNEFQCEVHYD